MSSSLLASDSIIPARSLPLSSGLPNFLPVFPSPPPKRKTFLPLSLCGQPQCLLAPGDTCDKRAHASPITSLHRGHVLDPKVAEKSPLVCDAAQVRKVGKVRENAKGMWASDVKRVSGVHGVVVLLIVVIASRIHHGNKERGRNIERKWKC